MKGNTKRTAINKQPNGFRFVADKYRDLRQIDPWTLPTRVRQTLVGCDDQPRCPFSSSNVVLLLKATATAVTHDELAESICAA
ncbi:hypothetical protein GOSPT_062_00490 [Gordonia sputi NBRC 100414]|uniref:Uncharacterized protein n=1 Tax=Gordonia sputi NBRC 100414 TaxID=1089453 RepID=H5U0P6_9ACTN|nr:hypothetical protein GOSPT_062_00490 [Gordonia sputi NBRC 100414]